MKFYVVGLDDEREPEFSEEVKGLVKSQRFFSGGKRHHELVGKWLPETGVRWIDIVVPLEDVFRQYEGLEEIVVFASGDPLFFGFANTIRKYLPEAEIKIYPKFNSLQQLAHRLMMPYHDMVVVSLTGRPWHEFDHALMKGSKKIGILTDRVHTPAAIAQRMMEYGYGHYVMSVGECLGNVNEKIRVLPLSEVMETEFTFPNCLILESIVAHPHPWGIPEEDFHLLDGRTKMITKMPVRLLSLSRLDLYNRHLFWDIGFCTGSVSIEAKLQFPHLRVVAYECREEGRELMEKNSRKFGTPGIEVVIGDFIELDVTAFGHPDAVFIGGHGGRIREMIGKVSEVLAPEGVVVFNAVSEESMQGFEQAVTECGLILLERDRLALNEHNPVTVMKAKK